MDYWAKKSVSQNQTTNGYTETKFYSVLTDSDRDGNADLQMAYKKSKTVVYTEIENKETAIMAAKPQDSYSFLREYVEDSWNAIWGNARKEDRVFNDKLTEKRLDNNNYSSLYAPEIANAIDASYKKFTKITIKSLVEEVIEEQITVSEWEDGEFSEMRVYLDEFESEYFDKDELITITNIENGQEIELPIEYSPAFLNESREGWALDDVSEKFDQVIVISPDQEVETINLHQETITISIPCRFSPYHDHRKISQDTAVQDTSFEVTGVLIVPADGQVYYTSDKKSFKSGNAKTQGLLFYFDSNLDNFYETVYVLAPDSDNDGVYEVMTIGYNSDNEHSFAPYEKVDVNEPITIRDDYTSQISTETAQYGDNWVYNFAELKNLETIFPIETYDGFEPKDHLFEVWKLVKESDQNSKFSQLFYEVRHKEYDKTWNQFSEHFWRDVGDQVFATLIASSVSFSIIAITSGAGTIYAHLAYIGVYSLISKFQMDMKAKEAEAMQRSETFYPEGADRSEPASLNQRCHTDEFWGDSMPAALSGHPGAYYTTVMGGEVGAQYTAQAIVSPPNDARFWNSGNFGGVLDYLGHNVGTFGNGDPDKFTPLDFDDHNLDFMLVSSELYAYNDEAHYTYLENPSLIDLLFDFEPNYKRYTNIFGQIIVEDITGPEYALDQIKLRDSYLFRQNTLSYLTKEIREASNGSLTAIKTTCVDGQPQYVFTTGEDFAPESVLFQPLIVSPERYEELENRGLVDGYIAVDVQASSLADAQGIDTRGVDSSDLMSEERSLYEAKIPLADIFGGFDYPIKSIEAFGIVDGIVIDSRELLPSEYNVSLGNLYLTKSLEHLIPIFVDTKFCNKLTIEVPFDPVSLPSEEFYYKFVIKIAKIVPDDGSEETTRSALNIATTYAVMGYFDQHTYAQRSAQMIAEVGYTEIMTIVSTAISAPVVALGAYGVSTMQEAASEATSLIIGMSQLVGQKASSFALKTLIYEIGKRVIIGTIKETIEEIVVDGYFETAIQSAIRMAGGSDSAGHWISTLFTSVRESANFGYLTSSIGTQTQQGFAGQVQNAMELSTGFQSTVATMLAQNEELDLAQVAAANEQFLTAQMAEIGILGETLKESKISLGRILATGIFTGLSLLAPSLAGFNLYAISKLVGSFGTRINAKSQNKFLAARNAMMLSRNQIEIEAQKVEVGKKPIDTQPENNLPIVEAQVPILPEGANSLLANPPVEAMIPVVGGHVIMTPFDTSRRLFFDNGYDDPRATFIKDEKQKIEKNQEKLEVLKGISYFVDDENFNNIQIRRLDDFYWYMKGIQYEGYNIISNKDSFSPVVSYHVLNIIKEKISNSYPLTSLESFIFKNAGMILGKSAVIKGVYAPLYKKGDTSIGDSSPYYSHLSYFVDNLVSYLHSIRVINRDDIDLLENMIEFDLSQKLISLKSNYDDDVFNVAEDSLDRWYVRLESVILKSSIGAKENVLRNIKVMFSRYYLDSGFYAINPLYRPARLMLARVGETLKDAGVIDYNSYSKIEGLIGQDRICKRIYENLRSSLTWVPEITHIQQFKDSILEEVGKLIPISSQSGKFYTTLVDQIEDIIDIYINKIINIIRVNNKIFNHRDTYRKKLLTDILLQNEILLDVKYQTTLFELLFSDKHFIENTFLGDEVTKTGVKRADLRPQLYNLWRVALSVYGWTEDTFKNIGLSIDTSSLIELKNNIYRILDKWIFEANTHYPIHYISNVAIRDHVVYSQDYLVPEYELVKSLWLAAAISKDKPDLSLGTAFKTIGYKGQLQNLFYDSIRGPIRRKTVNTITLTLFKIVQDEMAKLNPSTQKLLIYEFALNNLNEYYRLRGLTSIRPSKPAWASPTDYRTQWVKLYTKAYHISMGLGRHVGFDPIDFRPLDDRSFDNNEKLNPYARHEPYGPSLNIFDQILTDARGHLYWRYMSEANTRIIIEGFDQLVSLDKDIDRVDMMRAFKDNTWVLTNSRGTGWFDIDPIIFQDRLNDFNERRKVIRDHGLEFFIFKYYYTAWNRFSIKAVVEDRSKLYSLLYRNHRLGSGDIKIDYLDWLNVDFEKLYSKILFSHGYFHVTKW